jgi:hypothetical protein
VSACNGPHFARNQYADARNQYAEDGLQLHGLQSRPEETKYRWAAIDWANAVGPCPNARRAVNPIWKSPRYWPFWALVLSRDSHHATSIACAQ